VYGLFRRRARYRHRLLGLFLDEHLQRVNAAKNVLAAS
jgi:hypothetical protein